MKILVKFLILVFLFHLSGCRWFTDASTTMYSFTNIKVPNGTPAFQRGYLDGCSSATYSRGNNIYRARYKYKFDAKMIGNPEYTFGNKRGYSWCFKQMAQVGGAGANASWDRFINPGGYDPTFNAGNVNDAWGGMFDGLGAQIPIENGGFNGIFGVLSGGSGGGAFSANPLWAGGSKGQIFGQPTSGLSW